MQKTFLVELGTEELPPKSLKQLGESFAAQFITELERHHLSYGEVQWYASPRRLALKVTRLSATQPEKKQVKRGPAVSQAYDANGQITKAAEGWARGCGITVDQAERLVTDKGEWLTYTVTQKGKPVTELLCTMTTAALAKLPIAKSMRWSDKSIQFIRPTHTLVLLYGDTVIPCSILGIQSSRTLHGHRFMGEQRIEIQQADDYPEMLESRGRVIADYQKRQAIIKTQVQRAAKQLGGNADLSQSLLDEVTALVEWPVILVAKFEEKFLTVPDEALVSTMKGDQKYFPVYDNNNTLLPHFIFVANIESAKPDLIIRGNEKVIRPRLADAEFFYQTDLKTRLADRLPQLDTLLFHQKLGSLGDKCKRMTQLAGQIAKTIGADTADSQRAAQLSKCDLMTHIVFEFPETQGTMGMYLARNDKEKDTIATAIQEHYKPKFAGDSVPRSLVGCTVAIADKLDTLVGIFGIGLQPKGDKDPFATRRAALGILRISIENGLPIDLSALTMNAAALYGNKLTNQNVVTETVNFMLGRLKAWYLDQAYAPDILHAVLATNPTVATEIDAKVKAVSHFRTLDTAKALSAANKRVANLLTKTDEIIPTVIDTHLLKAGPELALAEKMATLAHNLAPYLADNNYKQILIDLSTLREPIDAFFEHVMVMVEEPEIRRNRLALLKQLQHLFLYVADISLLQS